MNKFWLEFIDKAGDVHDHFASSFVPRIGEGVFFHTDQTKPYRVRDVSYAFWPAKLAPDLQYVFVEIEWR